MRYNNNQLIWVIGFKKIYQAKVKYDCGYDYVNVTLKNGKRTIAVERRLTGTAKNNLKNKAIKKIEKNINRMRNAMRDISLDMIKERKLINKIKKMEEEIPS